MLYDLRKIKGREPTTQEKNMCIRFAITKISQRKTNNYKNGKVYQVVFVSWKEDALSKEKTSQIG